MARQLEMFPPPPATDDERLNAAQAEMRLAQMERLQTPSTFRATARPRHHRSVATRCPSCGTCVTIRVS